VDDRGHEMTEQPEPGAQSSDSGQDTQGSDPRDVAHAEGGRTRGETTVDEALGSGDADR
jgi:hypothetical protein